LDAAIRVWHGYLQSAVASFENAYTGFLLIHRTREPQTVPAELEIVLPRQAIADSPFPAQWMQRHLAAHLDLCHFMKAFDRNVGILGSILD
jgi:hypothetical protein